MMMMMRILRCCFPPTSKSNTVLTRAVSPLLYCLSSHCLSSMPPKQPKKKAPGAKGNLKNNNNNIGFFPPGVGEEGPRKASNQQRSRYAFGSRFEHHFPVPSRICNVNASLLEAVNDFHYAMMNDSTRNEFYYEMLKQHVTPETGVLEIGAGSGLLSIMAAKLGAKWVVAVEGSQEMSELARANAAKNHVSDRVTVLNMLSTELTLRNLPSRPHILVSEIFGTMLLGESAMDYIADVRERLLMPETVILPQHAVQYAVPIECNTLESICSAHSWRDFQLSHVQALQDTVSTVFTKQYGFRLSSVPYRCLAEPIELLNIDFAKDTRNVFSTEKSFEVKATASGVAHAWLYYWKASHPGCPITISTAPEDTIENFARDMQWGQALQLIDEGKNKDMPAWLSLQEGETSVFRCYFSQDRVIVCMQYRGKALKAENEALKAAEALVDETDKGA